MKNRMGSKAWMFIFLGIFLLVSQIVQSQTPRLRIVKGQTLTSLDQPKVKLTFDKAFKYVGAQSFVLYDVANAEQHFFVDADQGKIKRLYWIQFEGYLPSNTHTYRYQPNKVVNIGRLSFIADAYFRNVAATPAPANSDGGRAAELLKSKGLKIGNDIMMQRLVHLTDESKRNELMIIYLEDLSDRGITAAELAGAKAASWPEISNALLERALKGIKLN